MADPGISWVGIGLRFLFALLLVFSTYNPEEFSYYHWAIKNFQSMDAIRGLAGVVLIIGWSIYIRATIHSLGIFGLLLAVSFFGTLVWVIVDWGWIPADNIRLLTYIVLIMASAVLATGISWSFIRRKLSGQYDIVEGDEQH